MKTSWFCFVVLMLGAVNRAAHASNCCPGNNTLSRIKVCEGYNISIIPLQCKSRYIANPLEMDDDEFVIDKVSQSLIFPKQNNMEVEFGKYCVTKLKIDILKEPVEIAVVCFPEENNDIFVIKGICALVSLIFLALTFTIYCVLPDLRDLQGKCMMGAVFSLMIGFANLGAMQLLYVPPPFCAIVGYSAYVWLLAYFFWLNVISYNVYKTTVVTKLPLSDSQRYRAYSCYAWGLPLAMFIIALILQNAPGDHERPNIHGNTCFFQSYEAKWYYFFGIVAGLLSINVVLFIVSCFRLWYNYTDHSEPKRNSLKYRCKLYLTLFVITGISWIFEIVSFAIEGDSESTINMWLLPDLINGLQGVLIFLVLVVFRPRVRRQLAGMVCCCFTLPEQWRLHRDNECEDDYNTGISETRDKPYTKYHRALVIPHLLDDLKV